MFNLIFAAGPPKITLKTWRLSSRRWYNFRMTDYPDFTGPLDENRWAVLDEFLGKLPEKVRMVVWASELNSCTEGNAVDLGRSLSQRFDAVEFQHRPRKPDYPYYPLIGVMGVDERGKQIDYGIRFMGLPAWAQINSLIGAMQAVSFRGMTTEAATRIQLARLKEDVLIELFTTPEDESSIDLATLAANLAVLSPHVKAYVVMINDFPALIPQYSIYQVPHTIVNHRHHLTGVMGEDKFLKFIGRMLKKERERRENQTE